MYDIPFHKPDLQTETPNSTKKTYALPKVTDLGKNFPFIGVGVAG